MLCKFWLGDEYRQALLDRPRPNQNVLQMFLPPPRKTAIIYWLLVYIYIYICYVNEVWRKISDVGGAPQNRWCENVLSVLSSTYLKGNCPGEACFELARSNSSKSMESPQKSEDYRKTKALWGPQFRSTHPCPCLERSPLSEFFGRYSSWC